MLHAPESSHRSIPYSVSKTREKNPLRMARCAQLKICLEGIHDERITSSRELWRRFEPRNRAIDVLVFARCMPFPVQKLG